MKPFHFRLQTKLDLSCREESQAREELHISINYRNQVQNELDEIMRRSRETEAEIKAMMQEDFNLPQFFIFKDYLPVLKTLQKSKADDLLQAESKVTQARGILIDKMQESKTLQKLRDREWSNYLLELNKEEQKTIDELAINSHFRKNIKQA
ncbi:Flagellar export FliJ [Syntrophomonas zehnderi OL-4]|uniref:Flagellar FliJ protein n=1 Tax=Syntrophomonas zehnderi OL-4 TaxID=690567 RepID=A0A0E4GAU2_9FIRM|nr:flagellar export protein FliJ [Syntrophomonas zehnderi]CFX64994.1 Flagellar export FliJ [Syntrophomonas zehnderi OL-4]